MRSVRPKIFCQIKFMELFYVILFVFWIILIILIIFFTFIHKNMELTVKIDKFLLTLSAPTPQNGQRRSNNSSAFAGELFEGVWPFYDVGA